MIPLIGVSTPRVIPYTTEVRFSIPICKRCRLALPCYNAFRSLRVPALYHSGYMVSTTNPCAVNAVERGNAGCSKTHRKRLGVTGGKNVIGFALAWLSPRH